MDLLLLAKDAFALVTINAAKALGIEKRARFTGNRKNCDWLLFLYRIGKQSLYNPILFGVAINIIAFEI